MYYTKYIQNVYKIYTCVENVLYASVSVSEVPYVPWRSALAAAVPGLHLCRLWRPGRPGRPGRHGRHVRGHVARCGAVVEAPAAAPAKAEGAGWRWAIHSTCL